MDSTKLSAECSDGSKGTRFPPTAGTSSGQKRSHIARQAASKQRLVHTFSESLRSLDAGIGRPRQGTHNKSSPPCVRHPSDLWRPDCGNDGTAITRLNTWPERRGWQALNPRFPARQTCRTRYRSAPAQNELQTFYPALLFQPMRRGARCFVALAQETGHGTQQRMKEARDDLRQPLKL
jgi:hypothetical protein